jgi:hypothetical protein
LRLVAGYTQISAVAAEVRAIRDVQLGFPPLPAKSTAETGMSIAIESSDELEQLRTRLRKMTDAVS